MLRITALIALTAVVGAVQAAASSPGLRTVPTVDLERYLGTWYEIASYPAWFQKNCTAVTADYTQRDDGLIQVVNSCRKKTLDGKLKRSKGRAKIVDTESNAKLKVSFFGPFWGPYWIIDLDENYQWAVVGVPDRRYLWILSRTPQMDEKIYSGILDRLVDQGYDPSRLNKTLQPTVIGTQP
jgi:apolipoprotein D and lipocalin family protein